MEDVNARGAAVNALISKKSYNEALVKSLETPPLGSKSQEIKDANRDTVFKVIEVIPDKDIGTRARRLLGDRTGRCRSLCGALAVP